MDIWPELELIGRNGSGNSAMGSIEAGLDEIFAFWLGDKWLELGSGEGVDKTGFGDDKQQDLCASQCGELVGLDRMVRIKEGINIYGR